VIATSILFISLTCISKVPPLDNTRHDRIGLVRVVRQNNFPVMGLTPYTQKAILFMALFLYT